MTVIQLPTVAGQSAALKQTQARCRHIMRAATVQAPPKVGAANRVQLGDSALQVSECCLGTMTWGKQNSEAEAHEQLSYAFDMGVNFMDTAEMYPVPPAEDTQGRTDQYIGTWLKKQRQHKREDIILASKVSGRNDQNKYIRSHLGQGITPRVTPDQIEDSVNRSLQRLGVDYVDLLQIHWPDRYVPLFGAGPYNPKQRRSDDVPFEEQLRGLERVIKAGKVRYVGVSNETSWGVMQFARLAEQAGLPKIVSIQNSYSLLVRVPFETDLAEVCHHTNVGLLAYSPLAGGVLSGKYIKGNPPEARLNIFTGYMERYNKSLARQAVAEYVQVAEKHGVTPTQLALAWCKKQWTVTSTIIGATSLEQLKENIHAFDVELSEECLKDIHQVYKKYKDPTLRE